MKYISLKFLIIVISTMSWSYGALAQQSKSNANNRSSDQGSLNQRRSATYIRVPNGMRPPAGASSWAEFWKKQMNSSKNGLKNSKTYRPPQVKVLKSAEDLGIQAPTGINVMTRPTDKLMTLDEARAKLEKARDELNQYTQSLRQAKASGNKKEIKQLEKMILEKKLYIKIQQQKVDAAIQRMSLFDQRYTRKQQKHYQEHAAYYHNLYRDDPDMRFSDD